MLLFFFNDGPQNFFSLDSACFHVFSTISKKGSGTVPVKLGRANSFGFGVWGGVGWCCADGPPKTDHFLS